MRPAQTPRWAASATLSLEPAAGWTLAGTLRHVGRQYEDDLESDALPAANTLNLYAAMPLTRRVGLVLRGENVTGTRVVTRNQEGPNDIGTPRNVGGGQGGGELPLTMPRQR